MRFSTATTRIGWALLVFVVVGLPAASEVPPDAVAVVNGEVITLEDLEKRLEDLHGAVEDTQRSFASIERLLFRAVNDVLIGQEARAVGLHEEPPVPESVERNRRRLAVSLLEQTEIEPRSKPENQEIRDLFRERYRRATFHILTAAEPEGAGAILDALREGIEVSTVAMEMSIDPYREQGGLVESVARKDLQLAIAEVVFRMAPNEVAGPIKTDRGWSVLVAKSFDEADPEALEEARPLLDRMVRQRKAAAARAAALEEFRQRHTVWIDRDLVDAIQPVRRPDGRLTAESPGAGTVVARVGEEILLSGDDYAVALERRWRTIPEAAAATAAAPIILETLINERLLIAEAYSRGYHELPAVRRALHRFETEMIIPKYLESVLASGIEVSEEEKRAHYEANKESFTRPPRVRLGQITVATIDEAEKIATTLRGGTDLGWLAARHSTDGLREKGGVQDWWEVRLDGSTFNAAVLAAEVGTVLDPVQGDDSWIVYKVLAREEQGIFSYEQVSGNMRDAVFQRKFLEVLDRFIQTARSRSEIEIRDDLLTSLRLSGDQQPEEGARGHGDHGGHGGKGS